MFSRKSNKLVELPWPKPRKKSHKKKFIGMGLGSAVAAFVAGAFIKDKERHQ